MLALISTAIMLGALAGSLAIKRRRIWVRLRPCPRSSGTSAMMTEVEIAGLARTDRAGWGREFHDIADAVLGTNNADNRDNAGEFDPYDLG